MLDLDFKIFRREERPAANAETRRTLNGLENTNRRIENAPGFKPNFGINIVLQLNGAARLSEEVRTAMQRHQESQRKAALGR